jgi:hypothetical protein
MVVLAAVVTNRAGKLVVSRQFVEMTRMRIEGLITAFPKLLGSAGSQHTFVETENVRYLYHPLEGLYLILITSKQSNIVEDLETLKLMSKLWIEYCPQPEEEEDQEIECVFDFINAMDEVISIGYREQMTVAQVRTNMEMSSSEYRMFKELEEAKKADAREAMKKRSAELDAQKKGDKYSALGKTGFGSTATGGSIGSMHDDGVSQGGADGIISDPTSFNDNFYDTPTSPSAPKPKKPTAKMSFKSKTAAKSNALLDALEADGEMVGANSSGAAAPVVAKAANTMANEAINLSIEEAATISYDEDGNFNSMQVQGRIFLQITDKDQAKVKIHVAHQASGEFQFNTHPNIKKDAFFGVSDPWLMLAKDDRAFPCGNAIGILKWRYQTSDDSMSPVSVTCWPSNQGGMTHCNLEYNLTGVLAELEDFVVRIPIPGSAAHAPEIIDCDGDTTFDSRTNELLWRVTSMDSSNDNGALEFAVPQTNHQEFFPVNVNFTSPTTMCGMQVVEVLGEGNAPARFSKQCAFKVDSYQVGSLQ